MKNVIPALLAMGILVGPAAAHATVIDFEGIPDGGLPGFGGTYANVPIPYLEDGFQLTADLFASWDSGNTNNTGSRALFNNLAGGITTLTAVGGGTFTLNSIDLSELYSAGGVAPVSFTGTRSDSSTVSVLFNLDGVFGNETFAFTGWNDLVSVSWSQDVNYHQFDNINLDAAVPEPGAIALLGFGLAGLGLMGRRRKAD